MFYDSNQIFSNEDKYMVIDYCKRSLVEIVSSETMSQSPKKEAVGKYSILLTMLENFENKTIEMVLYFNHPYKNA